MPACPKCGEENPERARFCWSCGAAIAETPRSGAEERKIVSVLFVDLVGFTAASEQGRSRGRPRAIASVPRAREAGDRAVRRDGGEIRRRRGHGGVRCAGVPRGRCGARRELGTADSRRDRRAQRGTPRARAERTRRGEHRRGDGDAGRTARGGRRLRRRRRRQHGRAAAAIRSRRRRSSSARRTYRATKALFEYEPLEPVGAKGKAESLPLWQAIAPRRRFGVDVEPIVQTP